MKRTHYASLALVAALGASLFGGIVVADKPAPGKPEPTTATNAATTDARALADGLSLAFQQAAAQVSPSVVPIFAEKVVAHPTRLGGSAPFDDDLLRRFFGDRLPMPPQGGEPVRGVGSGVIVSEDGYILTNNHVAGDADRLWVLYDDERVEAQLVGTDPATDLAVIKIDRDGLPAATLGDSDDVQVGQWVIAVGNPYELLSTVTAGIVSAKGRASVGITEYDDFIQTDASINPGNSGGALADLDGRVVGINTAISSPSGGNVGIGFAIPIDMAREVMADLIDDGSVERGYLALMPQDLDRDLAAALDLDSTEGALVADVTPDGPADRGGLERGDVIVAVDGREIENSHELRTVVAHLEPGHRADVTVLRDGERRTLEVELGERPSASAAGGDSEARPQQLEQLGLGLTDLTPQLAERLGLPTDDGALVASVTPGSAAERAGLRRGDVVREVDGQPVESVSALRRALDEADDGRVALLVQRGSRTLFLALELG